MSFSKVEGGLLAPLHLEARWERSRQASGAPVCPCLCDRTRLFAVAGGHVSAASVFQGNSNNIATMDISAGFVGLDTYMEVPAVFLTAFATFAGPVLWASHLVSFLSSETSR